MVTFDDARDRLAICGDFWSRSFSSSFHFLKGGAEALGGGGDAYLASSSSTLGYRELASSSCAANASFGVLEAVGRGEILAASLDGVLKPGRVGE